MGVNWIDTSQLPFRSLLLLERIQISWLPWYRKVGKESGLMKDLAVAFKANPEVEWYFRHKCPDISTFLDGIISLASNALSTSEVRTAEQRVLSSLNDWLTYVVDPSIYDKQPFLGWDSRELLGIVDFTGKVVLDIGAGTGRLAVVAAPVAKVVYAIEPVENLRLYMRKKAKAEGFTNFYTIDGLIDAIPFPNGFADVAMAGHALDDELEQAQKDIAEMERVTRKGGIVVYCPGNLDRDNDVHWYLIDQGYSWSRFEEPVDGWRRKYWKTL